MIVVAVAGVVVVVVGGGKGGNVGKAAIASAGNEASVGAGDDVPLVEAGAERSDELAEEGGKV